MVEAIGQHALGLAPRASSSSKVRDHDRLSLGHAVGGGGKRPAGRDRSGPPSRVMTGDGTEKIVKGTRVNEWYDV